MYQALCASPAKVSGENAWRVRAIAGMERRNSTLSRRLFHEMVIVGLYGAWEQLVESLVLDIVAQYQCRFPSYSMLPSAFAHAHYDLSLRMLGPLVKSRKFDHVDKNEVLRRLHVCVAGTGPYQLNEEVFLIRSANIRHGELVELYTRVGLPTILDRVRVYRPFREVLDQIHGPSFESLPNSTLYAQLDRLAELRNDVAHGCVDNILSAAELKSLIVFVESLGCALADVTRLMLLEAQLPKLRSVGSVVSVFGKSIVCLKKRRLRLRAGDWLVAVDGANRAVGGSAIMSMEIGRRPLDYVPKKHGVNVALRVAFHAKDNYKYVVVAVDRLP